MEQIGWLKIKRNNIYFLTLLFVVLILIIFYSFYLFNPNKHKVVVCWGDSLTSPNYSSDIKSKMYEFFKGPADWPAFLQKDLGSDYDVINAAVAGENTLGIMLRQGSLPLYAGNDMVFDAHAGMITHIACKHDSLFERALGGGNTLLLHGWKSNSSAFFNPCVIDGREYNIQCKSHPYLNTINDSVYSWLYDYYIEPLVESAEFRNYLDVDTISKGTQIHTYASSHLRNPYMNIFFVGQNGGYLSIDELVSQIKNMVNYGNSKRYIVISFHHTNDVIKTIPEMRRMEKALHREFGRHYVNLRDSLVSLNFEEEGYELTKKDVLQARRGEVPKILMVDGLHFRPETYKIIAKIIKNKINDLEY